jgi:hypothetical protein
MKIGLSYDESGKVTCIFDEEAGNSGSTQTKYIPKKGERHQVIDLPTDLQGKSLQEIAEQFVVKSTAGRIKFEKAHAR